MMTLSSKERPVGEYRTVSILVLPTDEEAEQLVDDLITKAYHAKKSERRVLSSPKKDPAEPKLSRG